jgi:hypothetical protein
MYLNKYIENNSLLISFIEGIKIMKNKKSELKLIKFLMLMMISLSTAHAASSSAGGGAAFEDSRRSLSCSYTARVDRWFC